MVHRILKQVFYICPTMPLFQSLSGFSTLPKWSNYMTPAIKVGRYLRGVLDTPQYHSLKLMCAWRVEVFKMINATFQRPRLEVRGIAEVKNVREPFFDESSPYIGKVETSSGEFTLMSSTYIESDTYQIIGFLNQTKRRKPAVQVSSVRKRVSDGGVVG